MGWDLGEEIHEQSRGLGRRGLLLLNTQSTAWTREISFLWGRAEPRGNNLSRIFKNSLNYQILVNDIDLSSVIEVKLLLES